jgi:predicted  nucleic acid-binding Zn-ribbon protein
VSKEVRQIQIQLDDAKYRLNAIRNQIKELRSEEKRKIEDIKELKPWLHSWKIIEKKEKKGLLKWMEDP